MDTLALSHLVMSSVRYNVMRRSTCDTKEMPPPVFEPPSLQNRELDTLTCFINHPGTVDRLSHTSLWLSSLDSHLSNPYFSPELGAIFQECRGEGKSAISLMWSVCIPITAVRGCVSFPATPL